MQWSSINIAGILMDVASSNHVLIDCKGPIWMSLFPSACSCWGWHSPGLKPGHSTWRKSRMRPLLLFQMHWGSMIFRPFKLSYFAVFCSHTSRSMYNCCIVSASTRMELKWMNLQPNHHMYIIPGLWIDMFVACVNLQTLTIDLAKRSLTILAGEQTAWCQRRLGQAWWTGICAGG